MAVNAWHGTQSGPHDFCADKAAKAFGEMRPWLIFDNSIILAIVFFLMGFDMLGKDIHL